MYAAVTVMPIAGIRRRGRQIQTLSNEIVPFGIVFPAPAHWVETVITTVVLVI